MTRETRNPGDHKKNVITFQKNINAFINVIQGELQTLSVPTQDGLFPALDPVSFSSKHAIWSGQNPKQDPAINLNAAATTRCVGGMSNHWTCCTPEPHPKIERPDCFSDEKWTALFEEARQRIHTPVDENLAGTQFENSIRQQLVKRTLQAAFPESEQRNFKAMPLACQRQKDNPDWVEWSSSLTVFGDVAGKDGKPPSPHFKLMPETQCFQLLRDPATGLITGAYVQNLRNKQYYIIEAERYVIAAGAVLTPQILVKSGFESHLPALVWPIAHF